tara:strand:+ start:9096 stop:9338 length:243 start_codon:yes stop_codon:yes gene_type:complete
MPKHEDMDFPHTAVHCDDCWSQEQQGRMLSEMTRANDLKEKEMFMRTEGEWVEAKARPRPKYLLPPPQSTSTGKGGISLD